MTGLIEILLVIAVIGVIVYLLTTLPMPQPFRTAIVAIAIIVVLLYVLSSFGFVDIPIRPVR